MYILGKRPYPPEQTDLEINCQERKRTAKKTPKKQHKADKMQPDKPRKIQSDGKDQTQEVRGLFCKGLIA